MGLERVGKEDCLRAASDGDVETLRRFLLAAEKAEDFPEAPLRRVSRELILALFSAAIENDQSAIVDALLSPAVRDVAYIGSDDLSELLARSVVEDQDAITSTLLKNGADANALTALGSDAEDELQPLLHLAAQLGALEMVQRLVEHGANVHARRDRDGATALHVAARQNEPDLVQLLVKHGADVNAMDRVHGDTALHVAAKRGAKRAAMALVRCGASLGLCNALGSTPSRLAEVEGHKQLQELLRAKPATPAELT
ncbi:hypothetical protein ATCC90586_008149 [Pythium insidiosum]|nr:hypothetical protein ATCC90586_008149 [Pythium insidiosum]